LNDAGKYKCKLINGLGSSTSGIINLVVTSTKPINDSGAIVQVPIKDESSNFVAPVFSGLEKKTTFFKKPKGNQVRFKCIAKGVPRPDILWYRNGMILNEEDFGITSFALGIYTHFSNNNQH